ncbi:hypothetical protein OROHE_009840 [Orobanche hederae]
MERFLKRKISRSGSSSGDYISQSSSALLMPTVIDLDDLSWDPSERKRILEYHPNQRDEIKRKYLIKGPCQPRGHDFPRKIIGNEGRRFCPSWFDQFGN